MTLSPTHPRGPLYSTHTGLILPLNTSSIYLRPWRALNCVLGLIWPDKVKRGCTECDWGQEFERTIKGPSAYVVELGWHASGDVPMFSWTRCGPEGRDVILRLTQEQRLLRQKRLVWTAGCKIAGEGVQNQENFRAELSQHGNL